MTAVKLAIGSGLVALGGIGMEVLATDAHWDKPWFIAVFVAFVILAAVGIYILLAVAVSWIPPRAWTHGASATQRTHTFVGRKGSKIVAKDVWSSADNVFDTSGEVNARGVKHHPKKKTEEESS
jgi:hypothetical protein